MLSIISFWCIFHNCGSRISLYCYPSQYCLHWCVHSSRKWLGIPWGRIYYVFWMCCLTPKFFHFVLISSSCCSVATSVCLCLYHLVRPMWVVLERIVATYWEKSGQLSHGVKSSFLQYILVHTEVKHILRLYLALLRSPIDYPSGILSRSHLFCGRRQCLRVL